MPDTVAEDCGGTLELEHTAADLEHSVEEHIDYFYVIGWITRRE